MAEDKTIKVEYERKPAGTLLYGKNGTRTSTDQEVWTIRRSDSKGPERWSDKASLNRELEKYKSQGYRIINTGDNMQLKNTAFTRGQMLALNAIQEKMDAVGIKVENKEYVAFPGDNNPNSKVWYVGEGFGKSSTGVRYSSKAEAQAAADKHNRGIASAKEHEDWLEKQRWERESGAVRRAVLSRR